MQHDERPEIYTVCKNENGIALKRRSFRDLSLAAGLILTLGMTGLTLSGCSDDSDDEVSSASGGVTAPYSGTTSGSTAYGGTTTTTYYDTKTQSCGTPVPAGYVCTCNCV